MILTFQCEHCQKDKWIIKFNTVDKTHDIKCASCGFENKLEHIFGKRRVKNARKKPITRGESTTILMDNETQDEPSDEETNEA